MERLLIVGCGDVARRALPALRARYAVHALVRSAHDAEMLRAAGITVHAGDLDRPESLAALAGLAHHLLHLAPPNPRRGGGADEARDERTRRLIAALSSHRMLPRRVVYISTSGVYGDCAGERVDETRALDPGTARARRRVDAEQAIAQWADGSDIESVTLRVPGIYAADRLPLERLRRGTPVLRDEDDVYTNHIHADDLAAIIVLALERAPAGAVYNASDDSEMKMGEWFDLVAERAGLPRPPRVARAEATRHIPAELLSFMCESRRLSNARLKAQLGYRFRYPTVRDGVPVRAHS